MRLARWTPGVAACPSEQLEEIYTTLEEELPLSRGFSSSSEQEDCDLIAVVTLMLASEEETRGLPEYLLFSVTRKCGRFRQQPIFLQILLVWADFMFRDGAVISDRDLHRTVL